jgi:hypothetical protein
MDTTPRVYAYVTTWAFGVEVGWSMDMELIACALFCIGRGVWASGRVLDLARLDFCIEHDGS